MSSSPSLRTVEKCEERAEAHLATARSLDGLNDEWMAVCYFYSAYHLIKGALINDPVFDSATDLSRIDVRLAMEDRYTERHQGRLSGRTRELGVNDIVRMLYPNVVIEYRRLHAASIAVRYSEGLRFITHESARADYEKIASAYATGKLVAAAQTR